MFVCTMCPHTPMCACVHARVRMHRGVWLCVHTFQKGRCRGASVTTAQPAFQPAGQVRPGLSLREPHSGHLLLFGNWPVGHRWGTLGRQGSVYTAPVTAHPGVNHPAPDSSLPALRFLVLRPQMAVWPLDKPWGVYVRHACKRRGVHTCV